MAYNKDFIIELLDEGILSSKFSADYFHNNESLIGEENLKLYHSGGCSVNQSQLAAWQWLIGRGGFQPGHFKPLMCIGRRGDVCNSSSGSNNFLHNGLHATIILFNCLFLLINLLSLAIWSRCKAYGTSRREADDQLQFLRSISAIGALGCLFSFVYHNLFYMFIDRIRVFSIFHAILTAFVINMTEPVLMACHAVVYTWNLLVASYLIEHAIRKQARVFATKRRVQLLLGIGIALTVPVGAIYLLTKGHILCNSADGTMHLLTMVYFRVPYEILGIIFFICNIFEASFCLATIVLLSISACKHNCKWHQLDIASAVTDTVVYSRQRDDEEADAAANDSFTLETASGEPQVVIDLPPSVTNQTLADEFRLLIFWQAALLTLLLSLEIITKIIMDSGHLLSEFLFYAYFALFYTKFSLFQIPTPFVSRTFRAGFISVYCELKSGFTRLRSRICRFLNQVPTRT